MLTSLFLFSILLTNVLSDVYLHNPRGNNNRCDERSNNRNNANRLFDSQNNAAGGYAVSCNRPNGAASPNDIDCYSMKYYTETVIPIRWTAQHNCGENNECQFILQYSCEGDMGVNIRNGHPQNANGNTCTQTIPEKTDRSMEEDEGEDPFKYGKNEEFTYYQRCKERERNPFLFTADQNLKGKSAMYTRQNPNGDRYGFECPEERDYYPYWGESDWRDIAVLTTDTKRCPYYQANSRCNIEKHDCVGGTVFSQDKTHCELHGGLWYSYPKYRDCNFTCTKAPDAPINRLGSGSDDSKHNTFYWKLPNTPRKNCVLRLRYNISTKETPWDFDVNDNHKLKNNPVKNTSQGVPVRMAVNTAQYGRTFEDRTYTFDIIERPQELKEASIHNVNVQGKRGNIAQVRNCIEYDFVPNKVAIHQNEFLHFQFIGSDYNPQGNDGEGRDGTDRSNVVMIETHRNNLPSVNETEESIEIFDDETMYKLATINQQIDDGEKCYTFEELFTQNKRNDQQALKNCALLNRAEPYFNMFPVKPTRTGQMKAMSSRNNNFSNRGQKMTLVVLKPLSKTTLDNDNENDKDNDNENTSIDSSIGVASIIGAVIGCILVVGVIILFVVKRPDKNIKKIKRRIHQNTATYI